MSKESADDTFPPVSLSSAWGSVTLRARSVKELGGLLVQFPGIDDEEADRILTTAAEGLKAAEFKVDASKAKSGGNSKYGAQKPNQGGYKGKPQGGAEKFGGFCDEHQAPYKQVYRKSDNAPYGVCSTGTQGCYVPANQWSPL